MIIVLYIYNMKLKISRNYIVNQKRRRNKEDIGRNMGYQCFKNNKNIIKVEVCSSLVCVYNILIITYKKRLPRYNKIVIFLKEILNICIKYMRCNVCVQKKN